MFIMLEIMKHLKSEFDRTSFKELNMYAIAWICLAAAIVAVFLSLFIPPKGEVHASVLTYFGISSAFVGSLFGISAHYADQTNKFKAEITSMLENSKSDQHEHAEIK